MQDWVGESGKKAIVAGFAVVCLFLTAGCAATERPVSAAEAVKAPRIVFESLTHDFGTVQPGTSLRHSFIFKNEGTSGILIEKVKAG